MTTIFLVLQILLIIGLCQSFTPNFYNGRYYSRALKSNANATINAAGIQKPHGEAKTYRKSNNTARNKKYKTSRTLATTTQKPLSFPQDNERKEANSARHQDSQLQTQLLANSWPYTAGLISNSLNRFAATPIKENHFGSYQSEIEFEYPATTSSNITNVNTVRPAKQRADTLHVTKEDENQNSSRRRKTAALVRAASLNNVVIHGPVNETHKHEDQPLITSTPLVQYHQTVFHVNEPKNANAPFVRNQRNLKENHKDFNEKLIELSRRSDSHNNETQYIKDAEDDEDDEHDEEHDDEHDATHTESDNDDADKEKLLAASSSEQPLDDRHEMRYLHDIFLSYPQPHQAQYGHVEISPQLFEKRFETTKAGNRYKGEVLWRDDKGGYAQHHWDMALGKL